MIFCLNFPCKDIQYLLRGYHDHSEDLLLKESMTPFTVRLKNALNNMRLEAVFIALKAQSEHSSLIFEDGPKLAFVDRLVPPERTGLLDLAESLTII
jgi:hypothetical protein